MNKTSKPNRRKGGKHLAAKNTYIAPVISKDKVQAMEDKLLDAEQNLDRQYRIKKLANLAVSIIIVVLGISSVVFIFRHDREGWLTLRWLTVDGTLFTTIISFIFIILDVSEFLYLTELSSVTVYFMRLAAAVAEGLIMTVVLPIVEDT